MCRSRRSVFIALFVFAAASRQVLGAFRSQGVRRSLLSRRNIVLPGSIIRLSSSESSAEAEDSPQSKSLDSSNDKFAVYRNKNNIRDQVFSAISGNGGIKVTACTVRNMLNDMSLQHSMTETPTDALGRTVICGLLMANGIQDEQIVQITMNSKSNELFYAVWVVCNTTLSAHVIG